MLTVNSSESHPQVRILHLCIAFPLPVLQPSLVDGIDNIGRITVDMYLRILPFYGFKTFYDGKKFHPVVGRQTESPGHFPDDTGTFENHPVSSGTGIAARGTVRIQKDRRPLLIV